MADKAWQAAFGTRGAITEDPIMAIQKGNLIANEKRKMDRENDIEDLKYQADKKKLEKAISGDTESEVEKLKEQIHKNEIATVKDELDKLTKLIERGAPQKSVTDQIAEIKQAAHEMGLGGGKVSEIKDIFNLIEAIGKTKTEKGLAEQVKEAKDMLSAIEGEKKPSEAIPAEIALQLKKMEFDNNIAIEEMRDKRAKDDRDWDMVKIKWQEERDSRRAEIEGKFAIERERNQMISGGIEQLGKVIARASMDADSGIVAPANNSGTKLANEIISAGIGESGETTCPSCNGIIGIAKDADKAICAGCSTIYRVQRIPQVAEEPIEAGID